MFHRAYEELIRYASTGALATCLQEARSDFVVRTGELFESDPSFECRLSSFLEWYVLDRRLPAPASKRPVEIFLESRLRDDPASELIVGLTALVHGKASLFEFCKQKGDVLQVLDLLSNEKYEVVERRHAIGLSPKDIFEARLVPTEKGYLFTENSAYFSGQLRKPLLRAAKDFRSLKASSLDDRIALLHKLAFARNRAERYRHVPVEKIFSAQGFVA